MKATIKTATVGQQFGTVAVVYRGRKRLYTTEVRPYGFDSAARSEAAAWCERHGIEVAS